MPAVYSRAEQVIAWLGLHENQSEKAVKFLRQLQRHWPSTDCKDDVPWDALRLLFQRSYWERAWIIQEISVADRLRIMCGSSLFDFDRIQRFIRYCRSLTFYHDSVPAEAMASSSNFKYVDRLSSTRCSIQNSEPIALMELLENAKGAKATDGRDKVFALINLSYDGRFLLPALSYRLSPDQINFEISVAFVKKMKSYDLAVLMARPLFSQVHQDSRKWYPDWFCEVTWSEHRKIQYLKARKSAKSGDIDALSPEAKCSTVPNVYSYRRLEIDYFITNAVIIGEIEELSSTLQEAPKTNPTRIRKVSTQWQTNEAIDGVPKEHYLPQVDYGDQIARTIFRLLTLHSKASVLQRCQKDSLMSTFMREEDYEDRDFYEFCTFFFRSKINTSELSEIQGGEDPHSLWRSDFDILVEWALSNREFCLKQNLSLLEVLCLEPPSNKYRYSSECSNWTLIRIKRALLTGRRLTRTTADYLGWVPEWSVEGDRLALLEGCTVPVVLRCRPSGGYWIVGEGYFIDLMDEVVLKPEIPARRTWPFIKFY